MDAETLISPDIEEPMIEEEWMKAHRCLWDLRDRSCTSTAELP